VGCRTAHAAGPSGNLLVGSCAGAVRPFQWSNLAHPDERAWSATGQRCLSGWAGGPGFVHAHGDHEAGGGSEGGDDPDGGEDPERVGDHPG